MSEAKVVTLPVDYYYQPCRAERQFEGRTSTFRAYRANHVLIKAAAECDGHWYVMGYGRVDDAVD